MTAWPAGIALPPSESLDLVVETIADGLIVRPSGDIDINRAASFRAQLAEVQRRHPARLVLDLVDVPQIDSAVVATLVETLRAARVGSTMLVLCNLQERVLALLEIVGLADTVFTIADTLDEAVSLPNRRKFERYGYEDLKCSRGVVLDVSAGGLRMRSKRRMRGLVSVRLWNDRLHVELDARVVWSARLRFRHHEVGLQFANLGADQARKLAILVEHAGEHAARRKRKRKQRGDAAEPARSL